MTTNLSTRNLSTAAIFFTVSFYQLVLAQSSVNVYGSIGPTNVEVNGLGILDVVDPYIKPITQYTAGLQYEKYFSRNLALVTGAQYSSRGFGVILPLTAYPPVAPALMYGTTPRSVRLYFNIKGTST